MSDRPLTNRRWAAMRPTRTVCLFAAGGALSGVLFAGVTSIRSLQVIWYIKGDKFLVPTVWYWLCFTALLAASVLACRWLAHQRSSFSKKGPIGREIAFTLLLLSTAPVIFSISPRIETLIGLSWEWFFAPILFLALYAAAVGLLISAIRSYVLLFCVMLVCGLIGAVATITILSTMNHIGAAYGLAIQWALVNGTLTAAAAICLIVLAKFRTAAAVPGSPNTQQSNLKGAPT